ncbi:MAG: hypothetical protein KDB60_14500 [Propionibacteriaceae bacterium]|nr:hypothetical protein [Propionibacteriaceae bacterium]
MSDTEHAAGLADARAVIAADGADRLVRRPWVRSGQPHADLDLVRYVAWRTGESPELRADASVVEAGLALLGSAREELDQIEAGLVFAARADGMTWQAIGQAMGLGSAQAAQQRAVRRGGR